MKDDQDNKNTSTKNVHICDTRYTENMLHIITGDNIVNEVSIVSDGEHSSEEESEDEETAGKVVTKAGVEVYS